MMQRKTGKQPSKLMTQRKLLCLCLGAGLPFAIAQAADQRAVSAGGVVVTATRVEQSSFDLPVSIDSIGAEQIQAGQYQVNASDALGRVPGIVAPNQFRFSSDQQVSSRGFGARAGFGVRGLRLYADSIPQTMPDGQGQFGTFGLSSAERIEVMRGPFSALYGNSSGGVVQIFTRDGTGAPRGNVSAYAGSFDTWRIGTQVEGQSGNLGYLLDLATFETKGYREHSAAKRDHLNAKLSWQAGENTRVTATFNSLDQPYNEDPLGLNRAQMLADPAQAGANALAQNAGGSKSQTQSGVNISHRIDADNSLQATGWYGVRKSLGRLTIPDSNALVINGSGGISIIDRDFYGTDLRWTHKAQTPTGPLTVTVGLDYEYMKDIRTGYDNRGGIIDTLRRDEDNIVKSFDQYLQAEWQVGKDWVLSGGLRHSRVEFENKDRYIKSNGVTTNPDDSGNAKYTNTSPVVGAVYHLSPTINVYANAGKGFETPTFIELAYRPDLLPGLNFDLKPSVSHNVEIGMKAFVGTGTQVNLALFKVKTRNEIVVALAGNGRNRYMNAGRTERDGVELSIDSDWGNNLRTTIAWALLDARFTEAYRNLATPPQVVNAGNELPGTPKQTLFAEVSWKHPSSGFSTALEARMSSKMQVDDVNSDAAGGYTIFNWRGGFEQKFGDLRLSEFVRIDNLGDRKYIGGVIVNDANGRFFAPAPGQGYLVGISAGTTF